MAWHVELTPNKTYASRENAVKAFEKKFGESNFRYIVVQNADGRFFPVCLFGKGEPLQAGVHFHFNVLG